MVEYKKERTIEFYNIDGEFVTYKLKDGETLININCPLDNAFLIQKSGCDDPLIKCPACRLEYDNHNLSPRNLKNQLDYFLKDSQERLKQIEQEKSKLIKFLDFSNSQSQP